jgi:hypothetical protein
MKIQRYGRGGNEWYICVGGGKGSERMERFCSGEGKGDGTLVQAREMRWKLSLQWEKRNGILVQRREERWNLSLGEGKAMEL